MSFELQEYLQSRKQLIDQALDQYLPSAERYPEKIHQAVRYSVFSGGKRLRPILLLASYELFKPDFHPALPFACALEMIHTYSLIHDDLPSMDDDDFRRGKPTSHKVFGEAIAILAGDALQTEAFSLMAREGMKSGIEPERILRAIFELAESAGLNGMVSGQVMDLEKQGRDYSLEELEFIHRHKTGALIRASVKIGGILAGAGEEDLTALGEFGERIGLAFQIMDDILDLKGDERLGKPLGSDLKKEKATYPALLGLNKSEEQAKSLVAEAVKFLERFGERGEVLCSLARFLVEREY